MLCSAELESHLEVGRSDLDLAIGAPHAGPPGKQAPVARHRVQREATFLVGPDLSPVTPLDGDKEAGVQAASKSANTNSLPPPQLAQTFGSAWTHGSFSRCRTSTTGR
jgi:hypothetical protein